MKIAAEGADDPGQTYSGDVELTGYSSRGRGGSPPLTRPSARGGLLHSQFLGLRDSRFFSTPRTSAEVNKTLRPNHQGDRDWVIVPLIRLRVRHQFKKASKAVGATSGRVYVW